ncbi:MAG: AAA-like domain protein [candidate division BRC1 bacterium ADurb.BinA364]|nr:MAG: AAA-like domain protein [candidate division BRC1 bacterium ADurb.BinA364]
MATGHYTAANNKMGVLAAALRWFAQNSSGGLVEFIQLLEGLPPDAGGGISQAEKLAKSMADSLKARIQIDPLFGHAGTPVDPAMLFESANPAKVRLSIVNFFGLTTQEGQRQFLNRLAMTLFAWIKKHPAPQEQPLRGLLVIDEAKDFIPSGKASICKASLMRLAAQARKYGLGLVFATQAPRDIENTVVSNCFTQVFGRMNSPRTIEAVQQLLQQQGISGEDVPQLHRGVFYVSNASVIKPPARIAAPLCLSWHPNSPLTEMEIARLAKASATALGR